jgi:hypothetical protein
VQTFVNFSALGAAFGGLHAIVLGLIGIMHSRRARIVLIICGCIISCLSTICAIDVWGRAAFGRRNENPDDP